METKTIKWGIVGLGKIARKFCQGLLFSSNSELYALASASVEKETEFRKDFQFSAFYTTYEAMLADPALDIVYIATPNHLHFEQSKQALMAGKHVLCEKPVCLHPEQLSQLQSISRKSELFFMEALWTMFLPNILALGEIVRSEQFGKIKSISATFGFQAEYNKKSRLFDPQLGGGCVYDIGIYPLLLSLYCLGIPTGIRSENTLAPTGCDTESTIELSYPSAVANLHCSFSQKLENEALIQFEHATIRIPAMWHMPQNLHITVNGKTEQIFEYPSISNGYNYEADHAVKCITEGRCESPIATHQFSALLSQMINTVLDKK